MEEITCATSDGVAIAGTYYHGSADKGALLAHMMPATKESWDGFACALQQRGYHVLAIDLRGHGQSEGGPDGYRNFLDEEHQAAIHDVEAGVAYLKEKGVAEKKLVLVGASIGANLALQYLAEHPSVSCGVFLSAGLNYRGVNATEAVKNLHRGQRVFFVTSEDDRVVNNARMNETLCALVPDGVEKKLQVYQHAGHGTDMFGKEDPDLEEEIVRWL